MMLIASLAHSETNTSHVLPYSGVGLVIAADPEIQVMRVAKNSPADRADIHSFDRIIRIGDRDTKGMPLADAISLLKGHEASSVTLLVMSITNGMTREITLIRQLFENQSDIDWKHEVLSTYQIPGSTNVHYTIEDRTEAQQEAGVVRDPRSGSRAPQP